MKKYLILLILFLFITVLFANSREYGFDYHAPTHTYFTGSTLALVNTEHIGITNTGDAETYTINAVIDSAPAGTNIVWCDTNNCNSGATEVPMTAGGTNELYASVFLMTPGVAKIHFVISAPYMTEDIIIPFVFVSNDVDVLLVHQDDYAAQKISAAMERFNLSYGVWDWRIDTPPAASELTAKMILWSTGNNAACLAAGDTDLLGDYIDAGINLVGGGTYLAQEMADLTNNALATIFHCEYGVRSAITSVYGADVMNGHNAGFDMLNMAEDPAIIYPADADGIEIFTNMADSYGVFAPFQGDNFANVAMLGFDLAHINSDLAMAQILVAFFSEASIEYTATDDGVCTLSARLVVTNYPNPFNPSTAIMFTGKVGSIANVNIFNAKGQVVRSFSNIHCTGESQVINWDGTNESAAVLASGIYLYNVTNAGNVATGKMLMLK